MLSPEHVRARRRGRELKLLPLSGALLERAHALAEIVAAMARGSVGESRDDLFSLWATVEVAPRERRLLSGLRKLVEDACEFAIPEGVEASELRVGVFLRAAAARATGSFDRARLLEEVAAERGLTVEALDAGLYADLRGAQRLVRCEVPAPAVLVESYVRAQVQAVLLRAVKVVCDVRCASADHYRELFNKLKFRRLMHRIAPLSGGGYRLEIDGPFSLFQSVGKYGLELALLLPTLEACESLDLVAEVRWGERAETLEFRHHVSNARAPGEAPAVRDDVRELAEQLAALEAGWSVARADRVLDVPGHGVCVPDLVLRRERDGAEVLVELLGFWSRESVWRRVELAEHGLPAPVLFVVNGRLRVSEEAIEEGSAAGLYVYKTRASASALLRRAAALADARPAARG